MLKYEESKCILAQEFPQNATGPSGQGTLLNFEVKMSKMQYQETHSYATFFKNIKGQLLESPIFRSKKLFQKGLPRLTSGCINYNLNDSWYGLEPPDPQDDWLSFE